MTVSERSGVIAVVDDDPGSLESIQDLLESAKMSVRCFPSAASLLASGLSDVDVLVTDIGMPGMDGLELRKAVEQLRPELPVILITGRGEPVDERQLRFVSGFFHKPVDSQALLSAINDCMQHRKPARDDETA
jgi:FixJ family two-component response regulator